MGGIFGAMGKIAGDVMPLMGNATEGTSIISDRGLMNPPFDSGPRPVAAPKYTPDPGPTLPRMLEKEEPLSKHMGIW